MVGKKRLKIGKSKKGIDCQTKEIPMKWAFFAFLLLKSDDTSEGLGCTSFTFAPTEQEWYKCEGNLNGTMFHTRGSL
jgi:hypothetical protein